MGPAEGWVWAGGGAAGGCLGTGGTQEEGLGAAWWRKWDEDVQAILPTNLV